MPKVTIVFHARAIAFPGENGIKIYDQDGSITGKPNSQVRMNSISRHLAGHGICNNGNETVEDTDQRYMTLREYLPLYARREIGQQPLDIDELQKELFTVMLRIVAEKIELNGISEDRVKQALSQYLILE